MAGIWHIAMLKARPDACLKQGSHR